MDKIEMFKKMLKTPYSERYEYINTGLFNEIIEGYLILTLDEMGQSKEEIWSAVHVLRSVLDFNGAEHAHKVCKEFYPY